MTHSRFSKPILLTTVSLLLLLAQLAHAAKPVYSGGRERAAIRGYDAVAYFVENKPVKGSEEFSIEHKGANWYFSSAENRDLFLSDPEKYEPQYGGYCAYAIARDTTASSKPEYFTIHEGKLYLNYSKSVYKRWLKDMEGYIEDADGNWPTVLGE